MKSKCDAQSGQMKSMNGQKYVINHRQHDGYYVSKSCAILWLLSVLAALLTVFFLTYFLTVPSTCPIENVHYETDKTYISSIVGDRVARQHETVHTNGNDNDDEYYKDDSSRTNDKENDEIKLYEGWNPIEYE
uniref:CSON010579 protein n=1 Tax=Culicoides sonorensis TaxID=179676 RepID=A0A336M5T3_CULSO